MLILFKIVIVFAIVTQHYIESLQDDGTLGGLFKIVEFPRSDVLPMLNRKIFRGERVTINEHPYVVSVRRLYSHYLTGTMLTKNLIITVAHPLYLVNPSELGAVVGENYSDRGTAMLTVVIILIHEDFDLYTLKADIALLRLYEDVIYKISLKPMALISPSAPLDGLTAFVTGWGRCDRTGRELCLPRSSKYYQGERIDPMLRTVQFTVRTENPHCEAYFVNKERSDKGILCVGPARQDDPMCPCMAVPGAPLVVNSRLAGLLSWGFGCGYTQDMPLIYTNIKQYLGWLIYNVPILKTITKKNLTQIFKATKLHLLSEWLLRSRMQLPMLDKLPMRDIQAIDVDPLLSKLNGTVYDVRDFVSDGKYHSLKKGLYQTIKLSHQKAKAIKESAIMRAFDSKPFLSSDSIMYLNDTDNKVKAEE